MSLVYIDNAQLSMTLFAVVMVQARLTAGQTSQGLHAAVMQPHFWPAQSPGISEAFSSARSLEAGADASPAAPSAWAGQTIEAPPAAQRLAFQVASDTLMHPSGKSTATASESDRVQFESQSALAGGSTKPSHRHQDDQQQQQQQQQQDRFSNNVGSAGMTGHADSDCKTQGSLLGCTLGGSDGHRGPTVLVAVVDPVTGQQGYAKRDKAHGLEPRSALLVPCCLPPSNRHASALMPAGLHALSSTISNLDVYQL